MEPEDKVRMAKVAVPILFSASGRGDPLQRPEEGKGAGKTGGFEDSEDDYLANALARNAAAAVTVGKALYPAVKQAAVDFYPAVRDTVVESAKSAYVSAKDPLRPEEQRSPSLSSRAQSVDIAIGEATVREDRLLSKHVVYAIRGRDSSGSFDAFRRYSDFVTLRNALIRKWPGVYVPAIPPKQFIVLITQGNTSQQFIDDRRVMLEDFLRRLVAVDVLASSDEFQMFLRGSPDFERESAALPPQTYSQIAKTYEAKFAKYASGHDDQMQRLEEEEKFFTSAAGQLKEIKDIAKQTKESYSAFQSSFSGLSEQFQWVEEKYCLDCRSNFRCTVRSSPANPYGFLYDWLKCEMLDCRATAEAVQKVRELTAAKGRMSAKLESDKQDLGKLQLGKTLISHVLTFKSRGASMTNLEKDIQHVFLPQNTQEVEALTVILRIVASRLIEHEIPRLKAAKEAVYAAAMRQFTESSQKEMEEVRDRQLGKAFKGVRRE